MVDGDRLAVTDHQLVDLDGKHVGSNLARGLAPSWTAKRQDKWIADHTELSSTVTNMIDVRRLRDDLDGVKSALARRRIDLSDVDRAAELYARQLEFGARRDQLRARVNAL